ncbi:MAG: BolA family protein [Deltaproteobacteria bacterium]
MEPATIESLIEKNIPEAKAKASNLRGGDHFGVTVVSPSFEGCSLVEKHRMIYQALGDAMKSDIHALTIEALTPGEYAEQEAGE